ncbi:MAG: ribonuclease HII [Flavobacteriales bacterium]
MKQGLKAYHKPGRLEAGCDEAGRGCLAGPVVAAAVILPKHFSHELLNDSKKMSEKNRHILRPIIEQQAIAYGIGVIWNEKIDEINILNAAILAMHQALDQLATQPDFILVDGNKFKKYQQIAHQCIVKGDACYNSIAAASVLAKTHRDQIMQVLHGEHPHYDWQKNKAYPTKKHREAIVQHGITNYHRLSFRMN